ncbi:MAG: hypothetical protein H7222_17375 [Methylotenera sp.]|nr:hypothetical protein [Oligoflexia bacterium]
MTESRSADIVRLGTRKSLLAWAQSSWVAREVERHNPGIQVELVGIETRGDKLLDVSLQKTEGKEFFVAEIDTALRAGQVDFTVHSMKDLSLDRPSEFTLGAIPKRENSRDVVLFGPSALQRMKDGLPVRIGTSSPRRLENIPQFLEKALPHQTVDQSVNSTSAQLRAPCRVEFVDIRGNVNSRLGRVHEAVDHPKYLDAVVLAFAGIIRLWADENGRKELTRILESVRWMVLPLQNSPSAPAQGALAIECRSDDSRIKALLAPLHHLPTGEHVAQERALLAEWGGGCHQKFGASSISHPELGNLFYVRGKKPDQTFVDELVWKLPAPPHTPAQPWDGSDWRKKLKELPLEPQALPEKFAAVFVAHHRAVSTPALVQSLESARVWTSGTTSWFDLAKKGIWVEGCAEGLGFEFLAPGLHEAVLRLPELPNWTVLTHQQALSGWPQSRAFATYEVLPPSEDVLDTFREELKHATHLYWSSGSLFDLLKPSVRSGAHHSCGAGKTATHLRNSGITPQVFPSYESWKKWLNLP